MPAGPTLLQQAGARPALESRGAPLFHNRFFTGLWTQRNVLRDPSGVVQERWYGGRSDALLDGQNIELTNRLTLARAPGSTAYSTATFPGAVNSFYAFKNFSTSSETIALMVDDATSIYTLNPTSKNTILTKGAGAGAATFLGVGNTLYIGDGVEQKAYSISGGIRNWGIAIAAAASSVSGYAGLGADTGSGHSVWSNPTNIQGAPDGLYATTTLIIPGHTVYSYNSDNLDATMYLFALLATDMVTGIQLDLTGFLSSLLAGIKAELILNGAIIGNAKFPGLGTSNSTVTVGGPADLWGQTSLAPLPLNGATFGVRLILSGSNTTGFSHTITASLDAAKITIYRTGGPPVTLVAGGFSPAPATGFQYVYAYGNSSMVLSPATPPSSVIKPDATHSVQVSLTASGDPQVNQIWVFRTKDGGATYYNLPTSPYANATAAIVDNAADATLQLQTLADLTGLNTPPPNGAIAPEYHMGRVWVAVDNTVYYSAGKDLGLILGSGAEGFPPANNFVFPSRVVRLISISSINFAMLLVFTSSDVYAIYGDISALAALNGASGTVFFAAPLLKRTGLLNYWAVDVRGSVVYMLTNDGRFISFNPSTQVVFLDPEKALTELGFPIGAPPPGVTLAGGTLASYAPANAYVAWHGAGSGDQAIYLADGSTGWFRCNPNQMPDGGAVWSTKRNIVGGCQAVQSIETSPGAWQLLIGPGSGGGSVLFRDPTVFTDNSSAYGGCFLRMGAIILAQPGQIAEPLFITADFAAVGSQPTVSTLYDEIDASFTALAVTDNDPPHLPAPASVYANRYATRQATSGTQSSPASRWAQLKVDFGADTVQNELLSLTIFGSYEAEH